MPIDESDFRAFRATVLERMTFLEQQLARVLEQARLPPAELAAIKLRLSQTSYDVRQVTTSTVTARAQIEALRSSFEEFGRTSQSARQQLDEAAQKIERLTQGLSDLQGQFSRSQTDALFLSNVSYGYAIMATQWKLSRERVRSVVSVPTTGQFLISMGANAFWTAFKVGLAMATGGFGTALFNAFSEPISALAADLPGMRQNFSADQMKDVSKDVGKDTTMPLVGAVFERTTGSLTEAIEGGIGRILDPGAAASAAADTLIDPYEFFLDCEMTLRKLSAQLNNNRLAAPGSEAYLANVKSSLGQSEDGRTLTALKADPFWRFLFEPVSNAEADQKWALVTAVLGSQMRRMAWRMYCRSQWSNTTYDYTVKPNPSFSETAAPAGWEEVARLAVGGGGAPQFKADGWKDISDMTELPYKAWDSNKGWPAHWGPICSDFRGPEHNPEHPLNSSDEARKRAKLHLSRMTWISMAVVQCCQVKVSTGTFSSTTIDLERNVTFAGGSDKASEDDLSTGGIALIASPKDLLFASSPSEATLETYKMISGAGVQRVAISEIRFGAAKTGVAFGKVTGKKGILNAPNSATDSLRPILPNGVRATITVVSSNKTTREAYVYLVKMAGPGPVARNAATGMPTNGTRIGSAAFRVSNSETLNINLPTNGAGTYCITLDGRRDLRKSERKFFSEGEWYFSVT